MRFKHKAITVSAEQWTRKNPKITGACHCLTSSCGPFNWHVHTLEGALPLHDEDWIIQGAQGGFYTHNPEMFKYLYEELGRIEEGEL